MRGSVLQRSLRESRWCRESPVESADSFVKVVRFASLTNFLRRSDASGYVIACSQRTAAPSVASPGPNAEGRQPKYSSAICIHTDSSSDVEANSKELGGAQKKGAASKKAGTSTGVLSSTARPSVEDYRLSSRASKPEDEALRLWPCAVRSQRQNVSDSPQAMASIASDSLHSGEAGNLKELGGAGAVPKGAGSRGILSLQIRPSSEAILRPLVREVTSRN